MLKTLCLPKAPSDFKYQEIGGKLTDHYKVQTSRSSVTHASRNCNQLPTESVTDFSHQLQCSAGDCKCESHLDRALSDQFISVLRSVAVKRLILAKPDGDGDTFQKISKITPSEKSAAKFAAEMRPGTTSLNGVKSSNSRSRRTSTATCTQNRTPARLTNHGMPGVTKTCYRCGSESHLADGCTHKSTKCRFYKRMEHLELVCRSKKRQQDTHQLDDDTMYDDDDDDDTGESVPLFHVCNVSQSTEKGSNGPLFVPVTINGLLVEMELDTGSDVSVLTKSDFKKGGGDKRILQKPRFLLKGFSSTMIECIGETTMSVSISRNTENVLIQVVENDGPSLLGRD